jgi:hypothetical protein
MMAELIVTKKEIGPQLKKSTGTSRVGRKAPVRVVNNCRWREDMGPAFDSLVPEFGGAWAAGFVASVRTPAEGRIGTDTAAWTRIVEGDSQDRRRGHTGFDMACVS